MAVNYKGLGNRIKYYRNEKSISQEELGTIVSTTDRHISNIETGAKPPSLDLLVAIANALDVSADDLLTDSLKHSTSAADTEIHDLLLDCNHDEKAILTKTLVFLKALLTEFGI